MIDTYPPSEYPKLYSTSIATVKKSQHFYWIANLAVLLTGLILVFIGINRPNQEMLNWDSNMVLTIYLLLQYLPMMITTTSGFVYFNLKRKSDSRTTRTAELRPRRLFDFVSPLLVGTGFLVYIAFVLLVLYIRQFEYFWFGGFWNIAGITGINLAFAGVVVQSLYGKKRDPYQAYEDRARLMALNARFLVSISIAVTLFLALTIILAIFDLRHLQPISFSLYCQLLAATSFRAFRIDNVNFEVYRADPVAA